ncbi:MAG: kinase/pyrophosphorylase, partial [Myxococcota bacterium]
QRMETMRMPGRTNYSDMDYILAELEWAEDLYRRNPSWPVIDVTRKAVEETAATILKVLGERGISWDSRESGQL